MKATRLSTTDLSLLEPKTLGDERGFLHESFSLRQCDEDVGKPVTSEWGNHSRSLKNVPLSLHCQIKRYREYLGRVVRDGVPDITMVLLKSSTTFGRLVGIHLSAERKYQLWGREGFVYSLVLMSVYAGYRYGARVIMRRSISVGFIGVYSAKKRLAVRYCTYVL